MKKALFILLLAGASTLCARPRVGIGFGFGYGGYAPGYYAAPGPYAYYAAPVVPPPVVYAAPYPGAVYGGFGYGYGPRYYGYGRGVVGPRYYGGHSYYRGRR
jgi:hypothetical protein